MNVLSVSKKDRTLIIVGQIMECVIARNIEDDLEHCRLVDGALTAWAWPHKGQSCLTNLLSFYGKVCEVEAAGNGNSYEIIYVDLVSKAFDKVPHQWLLYKVRVHV